MVVQASCCPWDGGGIISLLPLKYPAVANKLPLAFTLYRPRDRDERALMLSNCRALRAHCRNLSNFASVRVHLAWGRPI